MPSESPQTPRAQNPYALSDESATPEALPQGFVPVPDGWGGPPVFPYRGTQNHGVTPTAGPFIEDDKEEGGAVEIEYESPVADVPPVPVRIVETAAHEYSQWRAYQSFAGPAPTQVVNRKEGRQSLTIKNIGTVNCWVGPDSNVSSISGYRLESGGGTFSLDGEAEVWAISNDATQVPLCVYFEFSTAQG